MRAKERLNVISVAGAHSGVGKTTLCAMLLKELKGFGAIKFTRTDQNREQKIRSKDGKASEAVLITDTAVINEKGKDTAIMYASGAEKVLWLKGPKEDLEEVLLSALERMKGLKGVIVEGNSPVDFLNTHLVIFIVGEDGLIKPSSFDVAGIADIIVVNTGIRATRPSGSLDMPEGKARLFRINLLNREGEINEFISCIKDRIA
jgi:molybdopterin-guanine dinucleotide biosynthesis protein